MISYTQEELEALEAFSEYITVDRPYTDMDKTAYHALHSYFKNLPSCVFSNKKLKNLYHFSSTRRGENIQTDSGIVSCTTQAGTRHIKFDWLFTKGDCLYKVEPPKKIVSASKLYNTLNKTKIISNPGWLKSRVYNEKEYIVLLEGVVAQRVEMWDSEEYEWKRV